MISADVRRDAAGGSSWGLGAADFLYSVMWLLLTLYLKSQIPLIACFFFSFLYLRITGRLHLVAHLAAGLLLALVWATLAKDNYHYGSAIIEIRGFCPFPVLAWGMGFFSSALLFSHFEPMIKNRMAVRFSIYLVLCAVLLVAIEYAAYHIFHFRNVATQQYRAIPVINCIHAPLWMQIGYFLLGPLYSLLVHGVNNLIAPVMHSIGSAEDAESINGEAAA